MDAESQVLRKIEEDRARTEAIEQERRQLQAERQANAKQLLTIKHELSLSMDKMRQSGKLSKSDKL